MLDTLLRQATEVTARKADAGKVWWHYRKMVDRNDVPAWVLYQGGSPARERLRRERALHWLADYLGVRAWPDNTNLGIDDSGRQLVAFNLAGWRPPGQHVRCTLQTGETLFDTLEDLEKAKADAEDTRNVAYDGRDVFFDQRHPIYEPVTEPAPRTAMDRLRAFVCRTARMLSEQKNGHGDAHASDGSAPHTVDRWADDGGRH